MEYVELLKQNDTAIQEQPTSEDYSKEATSQAAMDALRQLSEPVLKVDNYNIAVGMALKVYQKMHYIFADAQLGVAPEYKLLNIKAGGRKRLSIEYADELAPKTFSCKDRCSALKSALASMDRLDKIAIQDIAIVENSNARYFSIILEGIEIARMSYPSKKRYIVGYKSLYRTFAYAFGAQPPVDINERNAIYFASYICHYFDVADIPAELSWLNDAPVREWPIKRSVMLSTEGFDPGKHEFPMLTIPEARDAARREKATQIALQIGEMRKAARKKTPGIGLLERMAGTRYDHDD